MQPSIPSPFSLVFIPIAPWLSQLACVTKTGFAVITSDPSQPSQVDKLDGATGTAIRKGRFEHLARPLASDPARQDAQRFNDGACDPKGRFFAGTLRTLEPKYDGQLWMYDPNIENKRERLRLVDDDVEVSALLYLGLYSDWSDIAVRKAMV